jgi:ectoine hydroxylase-related dioxygenase (phytanoyl-CoA dioxygenase family)
MIDDGFYILKGKISKTELTRLQYLAKSALEGRNGVGFHALVTTPRFISFLKTLNEWVFPYIRESFFNSPFIIHAFTVLDNQYGHNFSNEIHRDIRFFSGEVPVMLNLLIYLDDFTEENGATWLLPGSQLEKGKPNEEMFNANAVRAVGEAGSILVFDSNVWHRAGENKTGNQRRGIAITLTKSCIKQLLDLPKALGDIKQPEEIKQLLGYHSRVPASLAEWEGERTYLKDQD